MAKSRIQVQKTVPLMLLTLILGSLQAQAGWVPQRMQALRESIEQIEALEGTNSLALVAPIADLGDTHVLVREYETAISHYRRALDIHQQQFLGLEGQDIRPMLRLRVDLMTRIGNCLLDQNRNSEALDWLQRTTGIASWGLDENLDEIRNLRTALALATAHTLPFREVDNFFHNLYRSARRAYPRNHPDLARILDRWVVIQVANENLRRAATTARDSLRIKENAFPDEHPFIADGSSMLASLYYARGRRRGIEDLLNRVLEIRTAAFGSDHPLTRAAHDNLTRFRNPD